MSTFRKGDKVSVTGIVLYDTGERDQYVSVAAGASDFGPTVSADVRHVQIVEPALKRGDLVMVKASTDWIEALVRGVDMDDVWLDLGSGESFITPLSTVRRVDQPRDIAEAA